MKNLVARHPVFSYVCLCLLPVHGLLWPLLALGVSPESLRPFKLLFALLPTSAAVVVIACVGGSEGVRRLFSTLWVKQLPAPVYLIALFVFPMLAFLALAIRYLVDGFFPPLEDFASLGAILPLALPLLLFPGLTEEFGWRGFLQVQLQQRVPAFVACLLVGVVWAAWHSMDFLMGNWDSAWAIQVAFLAYTTGISVIIGWIFIRAKKSVLIAILAHFGPNAVFFYTPLWNTYLESTLPQVLFLGLIWLTALLLVVVYGFNLGNPKVKGSGTPVTMLS